MTISIVLLLQCIYLLQLLWYGKVRLKKQAADNSGYPSLSIIIPFRNEVTQLSLLIESLRQIPIDVQVYWVNDHSEDGGEKWLAHHLPKNHILLHSAGIGKKASLQTAIDLIPSDHWVLTLDADIDLSPDWWLNIENQFNGDYAMVVFPIFMKKGNKPIEVFQYLEFSFFQILTSGSILRQHAQFSNGAHLAFQKKYFDLVKGYQTHLHISSGDDQFLLAAFREKGFKIGWADIPFNTISVEPQPNWRGLLSQRVRWAGKSKSLTVLDMKLLAITTAISNTLSIFAYCQFIIDPMAQESLYWLCLIMAKIAVEWTILSSRKIGTLFITLLFLIIYPIWVIIVGMSVLFLKQEWKGRPIQH